MNLKSIAVPVLIVYHKNDRCILTPPVDAENLKKKFIKASIMKIFGFTGGKVPLSKPCRGLSAHGFYGIEEKAVSAIAEFIKNK